MQEKQKHGIRNPWHALLKTERGVAMLEFALILPILLLLVFGGVEITRLVLFHEKIDNATSGVANVITQLDADQVACSDLDFARNTLMVESMRPFNFNKGGSMIISAIDARYVNEADPGRDNVPTRQTVTWQWTQDNSASLIGTRGNRANGSGWPQVFRRSPNDGGMYNGERIIAVETFYSYTPVIPYTTQLFNLNTDNAIYKVSYFRSRFGRMGSVQAGC